MKTLNFYFDYISNNAYLAWTQLDKLTAKHPVEIRPVPVLFAGLLKAHRNVGPAEIPAKREWMSKNILRKAALLNVPLNPPKYHPFNPLLALRASSLPMEEVQRRSLIDMLFKAAWVEGRHISEPGEVALIADKAGLDGAGLVAKIQAGQASDTLRLQTQEALDNGVFGIPSLLIDSELFFGYDDFVFVESYMEGKDPLDRKAFSQWSTDLVKPSARRSEAGSIEGKS